MQDDAKKLSAEQETLSGELSDVLRIGEMVQPQDLQADFKSMQESVTNKQKELATIKTRYLTALDTLEEQPQIGSKLAEIEEKLKAVETSIQELSPSAPRSRLEDKHQELSKQVMTNDE